MKRVALLAALFLAAGMTYQKIDTHLITANGRPFANAQLVNGVWAISLADFAKLSGNGVTLEPNFKLQGGTLSALLPAVQTEHKHVEASSTPDTFTTPGAYKPQKIELLGVFHVQKAGVISKNVFMFNGQAFVPLPDVAHAFGTTFTAPRGNLAPGQSLSLNFTVNGDGILALNH